MKRTVCTLFAVLAAVFFLCGCNAKSPDIYQIGGYNIVSITAVCGEKPLVSVDSASESDITRNRIYSQTLKYTYDSISEKEIKRYQKRLKKDGFHSFSENCWQTMPDKTGSFAEIRIDGNSVYVSIGNIYQG